MSVWERIQEALAPDASIPEEVEHQLRLATGALLLEMCRADFKIHHRERASIARSIQRAFDLTAEETRQLVDDAEAESECAVSLQIYTSLIKEYSTRPQKERLIGDLWQVAFADGELHELEERLVQRVASLIDIPVRVVERLRKTAAAELAGPGGPSTQPA